MIKENYRLSFRMEGLAHRDKKGCQLLTILFDIFGSKVEPLYQEPRKGDVRHSLADIQKGEQILNYEPNVGIESGLKRTVEYFKGQRTCLR